MKGGKNMMKQKEINTDLIPDLRNAARRFRRDVVIGLSAIALTGVAGAGALSLVLRDHYATQEEWKQAIQSGNETYVVRGIDPTSLKPYTLEYLNTDNDPADFDIVKRVGIDSGYVRGSFPVDEVKAATQ